MQAQWNGCLTIEESFNKYRNEEIFLSSRHKNDARAGRADSEVIIGGDLKETERSACPLNTTYSIQRIRSYWNFRQTLIMHKLDFELFGSLSCTMIVDKVFKFFFQTLCHFQTPRQRWWSTLGIVLSSSSIFDVKRRKYISGTYQMKMLWSRN